MTVSDKIEYSESDIIAFEEGLYGFEEYKKYIIIENIHENLPFYELRSVESDGPVFIVTNPFLFVEKYEFDLPDRIISMLGIENSSDVKVLSLVVIPENVNETTINLLGPIIINSALKRGIQLILEENYATKHKIFTK